MGSLRRLRHASAGGFTRAFAMDPASNRLRRLTTGGAPYDYAYDAGGNLIGETTSRHFSWNHGGQLAAFATQTPGAEPSVHVHYLYDVTGQRVKKLVRRQGGDVEVTHSVGGVFEHHRWAGGENDHVHVMDNRRRVALVRVGPAQPGDTGPATRIHLADHVGSAVAVLDGAGAVTNREEFTPYGETSFGSFARKRYRFAGREREEESGLCHHAARYLHPALGRWVSCDPAGPESQQNLYRFAASSPLRFEDPTGTEDTQLEAIGNFLQELADEFLEPAVRRMPNEGANVFGTRMHDVLQGATESVRFNAPDVPANRILTEVVIDSSGNIWGFGGKPGGAPAGAVTVDVAILNKGESSNKLLVGRQAKYVLAAGIDYKTGDARLAQHQRAFFERIKKPLYKLAARGNLTEELVQRSIIRRPGAPEPRASRRSQGGFIDPKLMGGVAEIGMAVILQVLITQELPSAEDVVRIGVETRFPILGIVEAKNHEETAIPIICWFSGTVCLKVAAVAAGVIVVGKSVEAFEEKSEEVLSKSYNGISQIYGGYGSF
jgi:RHS repeat-associated protein